VIRALFTPPKREPQPDVWWRRLNDFLIAIATIAGIAFVCYCAQLLLFDGKTIKSRLLDFLVWGHIVARCLFARREWKDLFDKPFLHLSREELVWKGSYSVGGSVVAVAVLFVFAQKTANAIASWVIGLEFVFLSALMLALLGRGILLAIWPEKRVVVVTDADQ
jgi:hypothetical protein